MNIEVMNYMTALDLIFKEGKEEIIRIRLRKEEFKELIKKQNLLKITIE